MKTKIRSEEKKFFQKTLKKIFSLLVYMQLLGFNCFYFLLFFSSSFAAYMTRAILLYNCLLALQ